jgi:hypothetical protein
VAGDVFGRNKNRRSNRTAVIVDAGQSRESTILCDVGRIYHLSGIEGSVVDYLASDG